jgi:hypothetical protein
MGQYEHSGEILGVVNPVSSHVGRAAPMFDDIREALGASCLTVIESLKDPDEYRDLLRNNLRPGMRLAVAGGDALVGETLSIMADQKVINSFGQVAIGVLDCGAIGDMAHALLPGRMRRRPGKIFQDGRLLAFHPSRVTVRPDPNRTPGFDDQPFGFTFSAYMSAIMSPHGAAHSNSAELRDSDAGALLRQYRIVRHTLAESTVATITRPTNGGQKLITEPLREMIFPNIPRMASRPLRQVDPGDKGVHLYTAPAKDSLARNVVSFGLGTLPHEYYADGSYGFTTEDDILLQRNGEAKQGKLPLIAPAGSTIWISRLAVAAYPLVAPNRSSAYA